LRDRVTALLGQVSSPGLRSELLDAAGMTACRTRWSGVNRRDSPQPERHAEDIGSQSAQES
jgi:hypothetical protein